MLMRIIRQNVGVDVDLKKLKVSYQIRYEDLSTKVVGSRSFPNNKTGFEALVEWVNKKNKFSTLPVHFTIEATGIYHENLAYYLHEAPEMVVHVELPNKTAAYKKSLNIKSKTDPIDAAMLALYGLERPLREWKPVSEQMREIKKLVRERLRIIDEKTAVSNQLHAENKSFSPNARSVERYNERLVFLEKQIKSIEDELRVLVNCDENLKERVKNVCTAKGIGFITVVGIVGETEGFALFKNRNQLISYAGYDVVEKESGSSVRGKPRISKKGNSYIRRIMYMPAMSAARSDENHKKYYLRIVQKGGIKMKGNVAIQRKLLLLIYALFTKNEPFDEKYKERLVEKLTPNSEKEESISKAQKETQNGRQEQSPAYSG